MASQAVKKSLIKSTFTFAIFTFISRILGLFREIIFSSVFGASGDMDAFIVAFRIPNFMRSLFAEGAFSKAFVPLLSTYRNKSKQELRDFIAYTMSIIGGVTMLIAISGTLLSSIWIFVFAPGFLHTEKFVLASDMLKITSPYIFFISLAALCSAVLNTFNKFAVPAATPIILNVCLIAAAVFFSKMFAIPVFAIAIAVLIAGVLQFIWQLPFLYKIGLLTLPRINFKHPGIKKLAKNILPILFSAAVLQISLLIDTLFASFLKTGSVSWLYYSNRLLQFPIGVFGVSLTTVVLPYLSLKYQQKSTRDFTKTIEWALRLTATVVIPAACGLIILAPNILTTLLQYGKFSSYDVGMTASCLMAFSIGLTFFIINRVLLSIYYSRQQTRIPLFSALLSVSTNIILNAILMCFFGLVGLAIATSISAICNTGFLFCMLQRQKIFIVSKAWLITLAKVLLASLVLCITLYLVKGDVVMWSNWHAGTRVLGLTGLIILGLAVYTIILFVLGIRKSDLVNK